MLTEHDERLIQRCVDNEISTADRRELIQSLEKVPDGWKLLACTFMEEQLLKAAVQQQCRHQTMSFEAKPATIPSRTPPRWLYHPVTSLALSGCVAFLMGILITREAMQSRSLQLADAGANQPTSRTDNPTPLQAVHGLVTSAGQSNVVNQPSDDAAYRVQLTGMNGGSKELPVYHDEDTFLSEYEQHRERFQHSLSGSLHLIDDEPHQIRFLRVRLENGKTILVPVEEFSVAPALQ